MRSPWCRSIHPGETEASLIFLDSPLSLDDDWIDKGHQAVRLTSTGHIDHKQLQGDPDLWSRQTNARGGVHRLNHIVDETLQSIVKSIDRRSLTTQHRIGKFADGHHCHSNPHQE